MKRKITMTDQIGKMVNRVAEWLNGEGDDADIIISSRVRLARNLLNFPFVDRASEDQQKKILKTVKESVENSKMLEHAQFFDMVKMDELDLQFLVERRIISSDFADADNPRGLWITNDEKIGIMANEEDHLRIQAIIAGFSLEKAWKTIHQLDQKLSSDLDFAFSDRFGYLTACPTNVGTGARFSVFIHLPVLTFTKRIEDVFADMIPAGIAVRGFYGEGSRVVGNFFQISNQHTLGWTEKGIFDRVIPVIKHIIGQERLERDKIMNDQRVIIEDKIYRALGIISQAKILSSIEFLDLLSALRLGTDLNLIPKLNNNKFNELMVLTQPAHIQQRERRALSEMERDTIRAKMIKETLFLN